MKAIGIIAEYNPFHNGHQYHLSETRKLGQADCIVAVMSGNFTQRGEPAMIDKWVRAEMAVQNGVDLVLELPFAYACNNAEYFAKGAIRLLEGLGGISGFSFGSEAGDLDSLIHVASILAREGQSFREDLKMNLDQGKSYPRSRYEALKNQNGEFMASLIRDPNNILGVEYLKEWIKLGSAMVPMTIKRSGPGFHELEGTGSIASATGIRNRYRPQQELSQIRQWIPMETAEILEENCSHTMPSLEHFYELLVYRILFSSTEELGAIFSSGEGLEWKLRQATHHVKSVQELLDRLKTKRYTETRLIRLLMHTIVGLKRDVFLKWVEENVIYARVLGLSSMGGAFLKDTTKNKRNSIPILTNINKEVAKESSIAPMLALDCLASDLYHLVTSGEIDSRSDYVCKPFVKI